jgi:hypothetical protein
MRGNLIVIRVKARLKICPFPTNIRIASHGVPRDFGGCENWQTGPSYRKISFGVFVGQLVQVTLASIEVGLSPFSFIHDLRDHVFIARLHWMEILLLLLTKL